MCKIRIIAFTGIALLLALVFAGSANDRKACPSLEIIQDMPDNSADDPPPNAETGPYATVHCLVDEPGVPTDLRVVRASSPEAGDWLARRVAQMRFKPRPQGCGPLSYEMKVNITSNAKN